MNADVFDGVSGKLKKPILEKHSNETEEEAKKRYTVVSSMEKGR